MKVSVIVPIYNDESFIDDCVNSIIDQTYSDLEIILVNDGSTDNTPEKLQLYKKRDPRIVILNQENSGTNMARFNGLKVSTGDVIFNMDSDDYLENFAIELLTNKMIKSKADIVIGNHVRHENNKQRSVTNEIPQDNDRIEIIKYLLLGKLSGYIWGRLIRRELYDGLYESGQRKYSEDVLTNISIFCKHNTKLSIISQPILHYRIHDKNVSYSMAPEHAEHFFQETHDVERLLRKNNIYSKVKNEFTAFKCRNWVVYCRKGGKNSLDKEFRRLFYKNNYKEGKSLIPFYQRIEMVCYTSSPRLGRSITKTMKWIKNILWI